MGETDDRQTREISSADDVMINKRRFQEGRMQQRREVGSNTARRRAITIRAGKAKREPGP